MHSSSCANSGEIEPDLAFGFILKKQNWFFCFQHFKNLAEWGQKSFSSLEVCMLWKHLRPEWMDVVVRKLGYLKEAYVSKFGTHEI